MGATRRAKGFRLLSAAAAVCILLSGCSVWNLDLEKNHPYSRPQKTILTVLAGQSTTDAGTEEMLGEVIESHFDDLEINWEKVDWGDAFSAQMNAKFAAGEVPDIMIGKAQDVATFVSSGNLAPVPSSLLPYIAASSVQDVSVNGVAYGIPYDKDYQGVLYNKEIFSRYHLQIPTTQQELFHLVDHLKALKVIPFASHFQETWYTGNILMQFAMGEVFEKTPDWGARFRQGRVSFRTSPEFARCFADLREVAGNTWDDAFTLNQADCDERFANGEAAMYVTGTWSLQTIGAVKPNMQLGIFVFPNAAGDAKLLYEPNMTFMLSSKSEHPQEVDAVMKCILSDTDLYSEILDFTKTTSTLASRNKEMPSMIEDDINRFYLTGGLVASVNAGNTQVIWSFQSRLAQKLDDWLLGKTTLDSARLFADGNRSQSAT